MYMICIYHNIYITHIYVYIYIWRERERTNERNKRHTNRQKERKEERGRETWICIDTLHIYIYIYIIIYNYIYTYTYTYTYTLWYISRFYIVWERERGVSMNRCSCNVALDMAIYIQICWIMLKDLESSGIWSFQNRWPYLSTFTNDPLPRLMTPEGQGQDFALNGFHVLEAVSTQPFGQPRTMWPSS